MKITRTITPIPIGRKNRLAIVAMSINIEWQEDQSRWFVRVKDYEQIEVEDPLPGSLKYKYKPIPQEDGKEYEEKTRTPEEVNALFGQFGVSILPEDNFTDKFRHVLALAAIYENQVNPPYTINPADLEIVDTETEVAPIPEPEV